MRDASCKKCVWGGRHTFVGGGVVQQLEPVIASKLPPLRDSDGEPGPSGHTGCQPAFTPSPTTTHPSPLPTFPCPRDLWHYVSTALERTCHKPRTKLKQGVTNHRLYYFFMTWIHAAPPDGSLLPGDETVGRSCHGELQGIIMF